MNQLVLHKMFKSHIINYLWTCNNKCSWDFFYVFAAIYFLVENAKKVIDKNTIFLAFTYRLTSFLLQHFIAQMYENIFCVKFRKLSHPKRRWNKCCQRFFLTASSGTSVASYAIVGDKRQEVAIESMYLYIYKPE